MGSGAGKTTLLAVTLAAADGLALAVLAVIEQATGGWAVRLHFLRVACILSGNGGAPHPRLAGPIAQTTRCAAGRQAPRRRPRAALAGHRPPEEGGGRSAWPCALRGASRAPGACRAAGIP